MSGVSASFSTRIIPRRRTELLRELLGTMRFDADGKIASFSLTLKVAAELGVRPKTTKD